MEFALAPWLVYILIFIAKISELAMVTLRTILTARDEKLINALLCFIQISIWVVSTATVINNVTEDPMRIVAYVLGCTVGCYVGMVLDEQLAIGQNMLTVIIDGENGKDLTKIVRDDGYAVTVLQGKGRERDKLVLMIATRRKKQKRLIKIIKDAVPEAMIIRESISTVGGYL